MQTELEEKNTLTEEVKSVEEQSVEETPTLSNDEKIAIYLETLREEQNLQLGIAAGVVATIVGAILWAVITLAIEMQIGYMAIGIGFLVGFAIQFAGKGLDTIFGIIGAALGLLSCLLGNALTIIGFVAKELEVGYFEAFSFIDFGLLPSAMAEAFSPIDLLFYGFAIYQGYKMSFREITEDELKKVTSSGRKRKVIRKVAR